MTDIRGDINEAFEKAIANIKVRYSFVIIMILYVLMYLSNEDSDKNESGYLVVCRRSLVHSASKHLNHVGVVSV